jgi:lipopolysaccharide export LptBFGC system permease protein LptF
MSYALFHVAIGLLICAYAFWEKGFMTLENLLIHIPEIVILWPFYIFVGLAVFLLLKDEWAMDKVIWEKEEKFYE